MKGYVDLYLLALPKKNLAKYKIMANKFGKIARQYGALDYREFIGDDLTPNSETLSFNAAVRPKKGEIVIAAVCSFKSRTHRDTVMKKMLKDPRMDEMNKQEPLFNYKSMYYGGFETIVDA